MNMHDGMVGGHLLWMLVMALIIIVPMWRICMKAGYTGWLGVLAVVPFANLILLYFLAFADWPALRRDSMRQDREVRNE